MARSRETFAKRQKERARQEKQREKAARKQQRKLEKQPSHDDDGGPVLSEPEPEGPPSS